MQCMLLWTHILVNVQPLWDEPSWVLHMMKGVTKLSGFEWQYNTGIAVSRAQLIYMTWSSRWGMHVCLPETCLTTALFFTACMVQVYLCSNAEECHHVHKMRSLQSNQRTCTHTRSSQIRVNTDFSCIQTWYPVTSYRNCSAHSRDPHKLLTQLQGLCVFDAVYFLCMDFCRIRNSFHI